MGDWATPAWKAHPTTRLAPTSAARAWAALIDLVLLTVGVFVLGATSWLVSRLFWDAGDVGDGIGLGTSGWTTSATVPAWLVWLVRLAVVVGVVGLSGAGSPVGRRRSMGLAVAELRLVRWPIDRTVLAGDRDPARVEPARWRIAARWLVPALLFAVLVPFLTLLGAGLVVLAAWLPALVGAHRSVYDLATGVAVVDGVGLAALVDDDDDRAASRDATG